ncbi:MAG: hypothetical protein LBG80_18925 [Bacteroidales bacterium]|nr:hypothetical protein [Bacteroidales bacterium]
MKNVLTINAGIACSDRANEVEPRPNVRLNKPRPPRPLVHYHATKKFL